VGRTPKIPTQLTHRVFSVDEAKAAGLSFSALRGKSWQRVGSRLYRFRTDGDETWHLVRAHNRILPRSAVFVCRTAAWIHKLDVEPANPIQVAVPRGCELRSRTGVEIHHCDLGGETVSINGVRATTIERTLLDMCSWSSDIEALVVLDMALAARLISTGRLSRYADERKGQRGSARLRLLCRFAAPAESPMETRLRWLLLEARLPLPEVQADLHGDDSELIARADLYYPSAHLVIEFDGGNHRDRLVSDDRRQNALVTAGYRVLRLTGSDFRTRPDAVVAQVREALGPQEYSPRRTAWY
jgi:hypothetical protein